MYLVILLAYALLGLVFLIEYCYEYKRTASTIQIAGDDGGSSRYLISAWFLCLLVVPCLSWAIPLSIWSGASGLGFILLMLGILLMRWTTYANRYYLRAMATTDDQLICTEGPYSYIRHPGYLGYLLAWIGFGLTLDHWIGLILVVVSIGIAYTKRILAEEQMMLDRFGVGYQHYMDETYSMISPYLMSKWCLKRT
ncbi:Protein-S-isoprenylcysteine O-methyltransferase [Choanephora cucurbitarum]|uniref:Protein-S-isoprenylcysteine O-methyltransferase n=1 Tax=Choanephora cucurbitarum TaxID=101091 RepID=A0A1C7NRN2_9FUNG|nr:Protein-S-isoprenylcysteine O-methyltransferase [Choanephora cucurbitarum]